MQYGHVTQRTRYPVFVRWDVRGIKGRWLNQLVSKENMYLFRISVPLILAALSTRCFADELDAFAYTCRDTSLPDTVLYSTCKRTNGSYDSASINLNQCLVNTNGILYCAKK